MKKLVNLFSVCFLPVINGVGLGIAMLLYLYASMEIGHTQLSLLSLTAVMVSFLNLIFGGSDDNLNHWVCMVALTVGMSTSICMVLPADKQPGFLIAMLCIFGVSAAATYWFDRKFGFSEKEAATS